MDNRLFSPDPAIRLAAAENLQKEQKDQVLKTYRPGKVRDRGVANAWVVVVGPSPGAKKKGKHPLLWLPFGGDLTLGAVHEDFKILLNEDSIFWRSLFGVLEAGFKKATKLDTEKQEHLKIALTTNLSPKHAGEATQLPIDELAAGMPRLWDLLVLCKPRVVVALTETVRELVLIYSKITGLGKRLTNDETYHLKMGGKNYKPRSCWLTVDGGGQTLLASLPQHPSKANTVGLSYVPSVGAYLGDRFRDALGTSDSQLSQPALSGEPLVDSSPPVQATA